MPSDTAEGFGVADGSGASVASCRCGEDFGGNGDGGGRSDGVPGWAVGALPGWHGALTGWHGVSSSSGAPLDSRRRFAAGLLSLPGTSTAVLSERLTDRGCCNERGRLTELRRFNTAFLGPGVVTAATAPAGVCTSCASLHSACAEAEKPAACRWSEMRLSSCFGSYVSGVAAAAAACSMARSGNGCTDENPGEVMRAAKAGSAARHTDIE